MKYFNKIVQNRILSIFAAIYRFFIIKNNKELTNNFGMFQWQI